MRQKWSKPAKKPNFKKPPFVKIKVEAVGQTKLFFISNCAWGGWVIVPVRVISKGRHYRVNCTQISKGKNNVNFLLWLRSSKIEGYKNNVWILRPIGDYGRSELSVLQFLLFKKSIILKSHNNKWFWTWDWKKLPKKPNNSLQNLKYPRPI